MATVMTQEEILRSLHESAPHNVQMEAWEADLRAFEQLKADDEDELRRVRSEGYQVATMYAAFQVVIITAVSQSSLLTCALWWCPASLSVAVYVATLLAIADKLKSVHDLEQDIKQTSLMMSALVVCLDLMQQRGCALDLDTEYPKVDSSSLSVRGFRFLLSRDGLSALLFLTFISVLICWFCTNALCEHCAPCHA